MPVHVTQESRTTKFKEEAEGSLFDNAVLQRSDLGPIVNISNTKNAMRFE